MDFKKLAKVITMIENEDERVRDILKDMKEGNAWVIGITGSPGSGKSTLIEKLTTLFRKEGKTVGIIAIDPTSPLTKGAFLGDRIRMKRHFLDDGVFIRSMGSDDGFGGLNPAIFDIIRVMDSFGFDVIIVETTGAGQSETDVASVADVSVLVLAPGMGDEIQFLKAGILEIADVCVVNKMDLEGSGELLNVLKNTLENKEIVTVCALTGEGVEALKETLENIKEILYKSNEIVKRKRKRILKHAEYILRRRILRELENTKISPEDPKEVVGNIIKKLCERYSI